MLSNLTNFSFLFTKISLVDLKTKKEADIAQQRLNNAIQDAQLRSVCKFLYSTLYQVISS